MGTLELLDEDGWGVIVHQTKERMDQMGEWCIRTHGKTGLTAAVIESQVTPEQAANDLLAYIQRCVPEKGGALSCRVTACTPTALFTRLEPYKEGDGPSALSVTRR